MLALLTTLLCSLLVVSSAFADEPEWWRNGGVRIRPQDARVAAQLAAGAARSATMRALIDRVEASNVIVYVGMSPLLKSSLSGRVTWMTQAGGYRYLRIGISKTLSSNQIIATLGHELQHVVEVIDNPEVVDERSLVTLYQRIGRPSRAAASLSAWETAAAQEAGRRVRQELVAAPATAALAVTAGDKS